MRQDDFYLISGLALACAAAMFAHSLWLFYEAWR